MACTHVKNNFPTKIYLVPEEDAEQATVWCQTCEDARIKDKGWYDYADRVANWKIICSECLKYIVQEAADCVMYEGWRTPEE